MQPSIQKAGDLGRWSEDSFSHVETWCFIDGFELLHNFAVTNTIITMRENWRTCPRELTKCTEWTGRDEKKWGSEAGCA